MQVEEHSFLSMMFALSRTITLPQYPFISIFQVHLVVLEAQLAQMSGCRNQIPG